MSFSILFMSVAFVLLPTAFAIILILIVWKTLRVVRFVRANHQGSYLKKYKVITILWFITLVFHISLYGFLSIIN